MPYMEIVTLMRTVQIINAFCGHDVKYFNVHVVVHGVTTGLI